MHIVVSKELCHQWIGSTSRNVPLPPTFSILLEMQIEFFILVGLKRSLIALNLALSRGITTLKKTCHCNIDGMKNFSDAMAVIYCFIDVIKVGF